MFKELSKGFMLIKISKTDFLFYIFNYYISFFKENISNTQIKINNYNL